MWRIISTWLGIFIMTICEILFGEIVLHKKITKTKNYTIAILLITSILYTANNFLLFGVGKTLIVCVIHVLVFKFLFEINWAKSIFLTIIYLILILLLDISELFFITKILGLNKTFCFEKYAGGLLSNIIISISLVLISITFEKYSRKSSVLKIENNYKIIILSFFTALSSLLFFYILASEYKSGKNVIIYLISIIVLISVLLSLIKQTIEKEKLIREYDKLLEFMTTYEKEIENQRILRHETKNEFLTIRGKIEDKQKNKEIIKYIDEILKEKIEVKNEEYAKFAYLPANGIKGLCYLKIQEAQDNGIKTSINISKRIEKSNIYNLSIKQQRNLGKILGVLLDNAIESSINSKDKRIGIEAYLINKECQIIISNSYNKNSLNKISPNKLSTKGKNRGHGLLLVKYIIDNNNLFKLETNITETLYSQKITIKNLIQ